MKSKTWFILVPVLTILTLSACAGPNPASSELGGEGPQVRPVDDIIDTELLVTSFANDGSATLPVETTVPVACSVVYGETPAFGSLTLDQDMAGGPHSSHNPLLTGLKPETTYYFRLQGVDEQGVIYLSEVLTFTTPPMEEKQVENLASPGMGATISGFSSAFGGAGLTDHWGAGSAVDDNPNSEWSSAGDGDQAWIEVQLARRARVDRIEFQSRSMSDGTATTLAFTVTTDDGEILGPFEIPDASSSHSFPVDIEAQSFRFDLVETTGGNTGIVDLAIYGSFLGE